MTQAQWYEKLKSFVPGWWFQDVDNQEAWFQAWSLMLSQLDTTVDSHITETFICQSEAAYLNEHGLERNLTRFSGELDSQFCERVRNITNTTSCPAIKAIVDALLEVGEALIRDDYDSYLFYDRENFYSRGELWIDEIWNAFSIIVDKQVHPPYSFYDREYFFDREDFYGQRDSRLELFELIVEAVNRSKALGTVYRLLERTE